MFQLSDKAISKKSTNILSRMHPQSYIAKAFNQLGNQLHYINIETHLLAIEIETFLTQLETVGSIDSDCHKFLVPSSETSSPTISMLPIIHNFRKLQYHILFQ